MSSALTFYFKEIFKNENDFLSFVVNSGVDDLSTVEDLMFAKYVYKILLRNFANSNVQYETIEEFKLDFANILEDNMIKYKKQKELAEKIYNLSEEEILKISNTLSNQANNPNNIPDDPTKPLDFISSQVYNQINDNKLIGYLKALQNIPTKNIKEFCKPFNVLFKAIIPRQIFIYNEEEDE